MRIVNGKTYLPDFFNSSSENINDNKPFLHTWSWFHLHQHSVSKEHEECQVRHLQNTRCFIIHTYKNPKQISANVTGDWLHYRYSNCWNTATLCSPESLFKFSKILFYFVLLCLYGNILKHNQKPVLQC